MSETKRLGEMMDLDKPYEHYLAAYGGIREYARRNPRWKIVVDDWADFSLPHTRREIPQPGRAYTGHVQ